MMMMANINLVIKKSNINFLFSSYYFNYIKRNLYWISIVILALKFCQVKDLQDKNTPTI